MADVAPPMVHIWARRGVPSRRAPLIEMVTGGLVTCEEMCPDEPWRRIPGRDWRWHKDGRPVIDPASELA